jgi:hypothetical protein
MVNLSHSCRQIPLFQLVPNNPYYHTFFKATETNTIPVVDGIKQGILLLTTKLLPNLVSPGHVPSPPSVVSVPLYVVEHLLNRNTPTTLA